MFLPIKQLADWIISWGRDTKGPARYAATMPDGPPNAPPPPVSVPPPATRLTCVAAADWAAGSLTPSKSYAVIPDERATRVGCVRVVDDTGVDYLYPARLFK